MEIEKEFVVDALLLVELIGVLNSSLMCQYIEFCADRLLHALGCAKFYLVENPFDWIDMISLQGKSNMFERRVAEYAKSGVGCSPLRQTFRVIGATRPNVSIDCWQLRLPYSQNLLKQ